MSKTAMRLALDALDEFCELGAIIRPLEVRDALREALAEQKSGIKQVIELYDSPDQPTQRIWVGLTDEEINQGLLRSDYAFKTAEAWRAGVVFAMTKLKDKNNA